MADKKTEFQLQMKMDAQSALKTLQNILTETLKLDKVLDETQEIKIDATEAKVELKELAEGQKKIIALGFDLKGVMGKAFDLGKITLFGFALVEIFNGFKALYNEVSNTAEELVQLDNTAESFFMKTNNLKAWEVTFKEMGYDAREADDMLGSMADKLLDLRFTPDKDFAGALSYLGIHSTLDASGNTIAPDELYKREIYSVFKLDPNHPENKRGIPINPTTKKPMLEDDFVEAMRVQGTKRDVATSWFWKGREAVTDWEKNEKKNLVTPEQIESAKPLVQVNADLKAETEKLTYAIEKPLMDALNKIIPSLQSLATSLNNFLNSTLGKILLHYLPKAIEYGAPAGIGPALATGDALKWYIAQSRKPNPKQGMFGVSEDEAKVLNEVYATEDAGNKNPITGTGKGQIPHYGRPQYTVQTWKAYHGLPGIANMMDTTQQVGVLRNEIQWFKDRYNVDPVKNPKLFEYSHHMGQGDFDKVENYARNHPWMKTKGDAYNFLDPGNTGKFKRNKDTADPLPLLYEQQSSGVQNHFAHTKVSSNNSTLNINGISISANNPKELHYQLSKRQTYQQWMTGQTGLIA